ncbi:40093_t:CDS:2, partial [Gigaspora margarita]
DILVPLFKHYLPDLFNVEKTYELPMQIIDDTDNHYENISVRFTKKKKEKTDVKRRILVKPFMRIKQDTSENFLEHCLIESLKPKHNSNKPYVWNFLYKLIQNNPETIFNRVFNYYLRKNENLIIESEIRKLTLSSNSIIGFLE